jgi:hypothetical protein
MVTGGEGVVSGTSGPSGTGGTMWRGPTRHPSGGVGAVGVIGTVVSRRRAGGRSELGSDLSGRRGLSRAAIQYSFRAREESAV